ncbi:lipopolysaccharide biosynthesis protein [Pedobacter psychrodurus]|uniref:Lipopolysaccharide biosynthesis protein n=1 Tax=Pedobacter psychrodurus TaxID=2530456 RepID=A0A4V2MQB4_9SPHI|nr:lipopolysaccharide biosynthesis protein [Pedobacter psychrodurus]TCD23411.1 lipopolysaccharide biosynthesis protein [Pedobacter psychrodurus]
MDIKIFFKLIKRYKWVLISSPVLVGIIAYILVKRIPKQYYSETQISTGLLDPSKKAISNQSVDFFAVNQQFSNIIEKFGMKRMLSILSYNLMIHDLSDVKHSFRDHSKYLKSMDAAAKAKIIGILKTKLATKSLLTLEDNSGAYAIFDLAENMGYGEDALRDKLEISHAGNSDLIMVGFTSEDPSLSAFVVNSLSQECINIYSSDVSTNQSNAAAVLDSLLKVKELDMDKKNSSLSSFKKTKGVLNLNEQSATVYNEISKYESQRAEMLRTIASNQAAIGTIIGKLRGGDSFVEGSSYSDNKAIVSLKRQLEVANNTYIDGGFKMSGQKKIDSLNRLISAKSNSNSDENVLDPRTSKQALVQQKLDLEIKLQQAKSSMQTVDHELSTLRARYASMVPYDADIQNYQRDADLATKEYMAALDQSNQSKTSNSLGMHLKIEQAGLPGKALRSKKVLYVMGSSFAGFGLCFGVLLLMLILDQKIKDVDRLKIATGSEVIGSFSKITTSERNPSYIWNDNSSATHDDYKNEIRSLRFELLKKLDQNKEQVLGISSLLPKEGKTQLAYNLAYSFAMVGRKTLLIAEELPLEGAAQKKIASSQSFQNFIVKRKLQTEDLITVMTKNAVKKSLLETQSLKNLRSAFDELRKEFDNIVIDISSLQDLNLTKEWLLFVDMSVLVFRSGNIISDDQRKHIEYIKQQQGFAGWVFYDHPIT